jgi:hypothetical protein
MAGFVRAGSAIRSCFVGTLQVSNYLRASHERFCLLIAGFLEPPQLAESHSGHGFRPHLANPPKSRCFGGRNGENPAMASATGAIRQRPNPFGSRISIAIHVRIGSSSLWHGLSKVRILCLRCRFRPHFRLPAKTLPIGANQHRPEAMKIAHTGGQEPIGPAPAKTGHEVTLKL